MTDLLIEIGYAPRDARERIETLEVILGAASLELDIAVCLLGSGSNHLRGDFERRWLQLTDFGLARILVFDAHRDSDSSVPFERISRAEVEQVRRKALTIMTL